MNTVNAVNVIKLGPCLVDTDACTLEREGEKSKVTPRSMDVLLYLAGHADRIVSSDELLDTFWSPVASDHAVHKAIAELRNALGDNVRTQRFIKTIPKRGYKLLVTPGALESESAPGFMARLAAKLARLGQCLRYCDYKTLGTGLVVLVLLGAVTLLAPHLERAPGRRSSVILALYPFQLQASGSEAESLFAQGLYSNLVTRLSGLQALRVIPVNSFGPADSDSNPELGNGPGVVDYQVRGVIVPTDKEASLYLNLVHSPSGIVEYSERLKVKPSAALEELDPLTDALVEIIVSHLMEYHLDNTGTIRART